MSVTQGNYITALVSADLSAKQYYIVILDSTGKAALASASSSAISGVLDEVPQKSTGECSIKHISANGTGKVKAGGTISKGDLLTSDSNGLAVTATQTTAGSQPTVRVFGRARVAAVVNDVLEFEHCFFMY